MHKLSFDPFLFMWSQSNKQCLNTNKCFQSIESNLGLAKQARYPESKVNKIELIRPSIFRTEVNSGQIQMGGEVRLAILSFMNYQSLCFTGVDCGDETMQLRTHFFYLRFKLLLHLVKVVECRAMLRVNNSCLVVGLLLSCLCFG